jgi:hypothetical protein
MQKLNPDLLGPCMLYCGYCGVHLKGKCDGCGPMTRKRAKEGVVFCAMVKCASEKGVKMCGECGEYPCARFDAGSTDDHALFSKEFTEYLRDNCR